jgi:hypothetical protein
MTDMTTSGAAITMPKGTHLAYTVYHETHWWRGSLRLSGRQSLPNEGQPCIQVAASAKGQGGGVRWEFSVVEVDLGQKALRLDIFDEGWEAFALMPAFFAGLAAGGVETLDDVRELLDSLGAVDETEREG